MRQEEKKQEFVVDKSLFVVDTATNNDAEGEQYVMNDMSEYKIIISLLKKCDDQDWSRYLEGFKNEKINDERLKFIDLNDKEAWKELIPEMGVRSQFKSLWEKR